MPKINVYLPEDLAAAVRAADVPVSAVCQKALADAVQIVNTVRRSVTALRDPTFDPDAHPQFATRLTGRMTARLRQVLALAHEAAGLEHPVQTRHLLVAIVDERDNLAVRLLQALGHDADEIRAAALRVTVDEPLPDLASAASETGSDPGSGTASNTGSDTAAGTGSDTLPDAAPPGQGRGQGSGQASLWTGLTLSGRVAIGSALEESVDLGHNYLGCEHLLLGLLEDPQGGAGQVLQSAGLDKAGLRRAITSAMAGFTQARQVPVDPDAAKLDQVTRRLDALERRLAAADL
jgi:ATP-dependent Clp protease ATP-binding subunit ClpA